MKLTNTFIKGVMNKDLDERLLPDGQYRDAWNVEVSASEGAGVGAIENVRGNTNLTSLSLTAAARTIGAITDDANHNIYWFVADTSFDYVFRYNEVNDTTTTLLKDTKARVLNFDSNYLITGVNIINDLLFWTDNLNPPRRLNVNRYYATDDFIEDDISVIVKPPLLAPTIELSSTTTVYDENNLDDKFLMFSYRYKYENDEYSAISPFSSTAFYPTPFSYTVGDDSFTSMINTYNQVNVSVYINGVAGPPWVPDERLKEVQILFRDSAHTNIYIIESFTIEDISSQNFISATGYFDITFNNNKIYAVLPVDEITRLFDNVPLKSKAQELIGSRIAYGNYVQFYNITNGLGSEITIDYNLVLRSYSLPDSTPLPTFRSDRDYEIGIAYLDDYGRMTTVLTAENNTINIPPNFSDTANDIMVEINNLPPSFATKYRLFIKQAKGDYYNIFPLYYYREGLYIWFLINTSDLDKVKIGSYIICKSIAAVATKSNKNYKVLDVKSQPIDFLDNTDPQLEGLYFKIRVEDISLFTGDDLFERTYLETGRGSVETPGAYSGDYKSFPYIHDLPNSGVGVINIPVYYGSSGTNNVLIPDSYVPIAGTTRDYRLKILIIDPNPTTGANRYRVDQLQTSPSGGGYSQIKSPADIATALQTVSDNSQAIYKFKFPTSIGYKVGDYWIVNIHTNGLTSIGGVNSGWQENMSFNWTTSGGFRGQTCLPQGIDWTTTDAGGTTTSIPQTGYVTQDREIEAGAMITMNITEYGYAGGGQTITENEFRADKSYVNIEEWFYESGAFLGFKHESWSQGNVLYELGPSHVFFRRGWGRENATTSGCPESNKIYQQNTSFAPYQDWSEYNAYKTVWMCIRGAQWNTSMTAGPNSNCDSAAYIQVEFNITQQESENVFESEPLENDVDIYYELNETLDITAGLHQGNIGITGNQIAGSIPARVHLNKSLYSGPYLDVENSNYNAYCFGNGVEGFRIRGDFNAPMLKYSPRVSSVIEEYQEQHVEEAITYSGIYRENTGINNLNEFNLSLANFKYLDKFFGSIQKLHARDTNLVAFQENKVSKILYGKNLLSDAVGGGVIASIPEVLGTQVAFAGEYGISTNPESFATWGTEMYFTDLRRGAVMRLGGNGMYEVSSLGMKDWFKDLFQGASTQKIGAIDPFKERYVLSHNDTLSVPCSFDVNFNKPGLNAGNAVNTVCATVSSNTTWTVTLVDTGDGTSWLKINTAASPYAGENNEVVCFTYSGNATGSSRSMTVRFTACGDTSDYTAFQSSEPEITRIIFILGLEEDEDLEVTQSYDFTSNTGGAITFTKFPLTKATVSLENSYRNFAAKESIPTTGDTIDMKTLEAGTTTEKPFAPSLGNTMRYLVSDTTYSDEDVAALITASTSVVPGLAAGVYTSSFVYSRPADEKYIYLIWDYRNIVSAGDTVTLASGITGTTTIQVDYDDRIGRVSISYNANATANTFSLKWNDRVVATTGSVAGAGTLSFLKDAATPNEVYLIVESGGTDDGWTVVTSATTLTSFLIDTNNDDLSTVCARVPGTTHYHDGAAALPVIGDRIFTTAAGEVAYDGGSYLHKIGASDDYVGVNEDGTVIVSGDCAACAEVAIPVISTPSFTAFAGDAIDLTLAVTNNPASWAIVTTCNTYDLNGGVDGAIFTTTDCSTAASATIVVAKNSFTRICTTSGPVVASGTGTSTLIGTCDDNVMPPGLSLNKLTGVISGTTRITGVYAVTFTATNCFGTSVNTAITFTIVPATENKRFNMDTANPTATSVLACAVTPAYGIMYHNGEADYPVVNDYVFEICDCELKPYNGGYLWYVTDELTVGKNNVLRIDSTGQVVDKATCP